MTPKRSILATIAALATLVAVPTAATAAAPTLTFPRTYTEDQQIQFSGAGYLPSSEVTITTFINGEIRGSYTTSSDPAGNLTDTATVPSADNFLLPNEDREEVTFNASDPALTGTGRITFTRWWGASPPRVTPGKRAAITAYGWAFATGKTLWYQFRQGGRLKATIRAGKIKGPCGDLGARVKVPRSLKPGTYRTVLSTSTHRYSSRYTWLKTRVKK